MFAYVLDAKNLPFTEWVSCLTRGHTLQILRVGADRRVSPHRLALQLEAIQDSDVLSSCEHPLLELRE